MITTRLLDIKSANFEMGDDYFIQLSSKMQGLVESRPGQNGQCLDDFLDKIEKQAIMVDEGGVGAYIRTAPIKQKKEPKKNNGKSWLNWRDWGHLILDEAKGLAVSAYQKAKGQTTEDVFGVEFEDVKTQVRTRETKDGTVYEIFVNTTPDLVSDIRDELTYAPPLKVLDERVDPRRERRNIAGFLKSLGEVYQKLGVSNGDLVFHTSFKPYVDVEKVPELIKGDTIKDTTFYTCPEPELNFTVSNGEIRPKRRRTSTTKRQTRKQSPTPSGKRTSRARSDLAQKIGNIDFKNPDTIYKELAKHVKGQDEQLRSVADVICDHYGVMTSEEFLADIKANVLVAGPSGCGKTYLGNTIARILGGLPYYQADLTGKSQAAYRGGSVSSILYGAIKEAGSIEKLEQGAVIMLDEVDKIAKKKGRDTSDVATDDVQNELLKMLNGDVVTLDEDEGTQVDCKNILFICAGAFPELQGKTIAEQALIDYGLKPEFVRRLPCLLQMNQLSAKDLQEILENPENSLIAQYQRLFNGQYDIALDFGPPARKYIAELAHKRKLGASGLNRILETTLRGQRSPSGEYVQKNGKGSKLHVTKTMVEKQVRKYNGIGGPKK